MRHLLALALALLAGTLGPAPALAELAELPTSLDFGVTPVACGVPTGFVSLANPGPRAVRIDRIVVEGAPFVVLRPTPALPLALGPGERATLGLALDAPPEGPWQARLLISTDAETHTVAMSGRVRSVVEDRRRAPPPPAVDTLFAIDDAPSMRDHQAALAANFRAWAQYVRAQGIDARVAVVTLARARDGRFVPGPQGRTVLHSSDADFEAALAVMTSVGASGPADHSGLHVVQRALADDNLTGANAGFLRDDALLSVIIVSNAADASARDLPDYETELRGIKGFRSPAQVHVDAIVGEGRTGCARTMGRRASPGRRYAHLAEATGGVVASICDADWSRALEDLSTRAFSNLRFPLQLSEVPAPSSIEVFEELTFRPATAAGGTVNWVYDDGSNRVRLSPFALPAPSSEMLVRYTPACRLATAR